MAENLETTPISASKPLNETILADVWRIFTIYDRSAVNAQQRFTFLRKLILILSVVATTLAIIESQFGSYLPQLAQRHILFYPVIITPIVVSILLAGTVKFGRGVNWILLRASAETVKQEIYRYRTQVGDYGDNKTRDVTRDVKLYQEIQTIGERLMKTQVNQAALVLPEVTAGDSQSLLKIIRAGISKQDSDPFSALTAEQYIEYRLMNQLAWYRRKTLILDKQWQILQWLIYVLGGVGTFLAAIQKEVWIAVSNAVSASLLSFLEFKRLDATLVGYNQTATNLENILCWWHALTLEAKTDPKNIEKLVESSEKVIQAETTGWVQEMRDALAGLHKDEVQSPPAEVTEEMTKKEEVLPAEVTDQSVKEKEQVLPAEATDQSVISEPIK